MSTEHFVNRINQGPFFDQLKPVEESEPIAEPKLDKLGPAPVFEAGAPTQADWVEKWQKTSVSSDVPPADVIVEEPNDNIGNGGLPSLTSLIVSRTEFERFKTQVIVALKHMGVDTRKYFPE